MTLTVLPHPDGQILAAKYDDGSVVERKTEQGKSYVIPTWCGMGPSDHACAWGCMSVLQGRVTGRDYCKECPEYCPEPGEVRFLMSERLEKPDDWESFHIALNYIDVDPSRFPCFAVVYRHAEKNRWGHYQFREEVEFTYE